MFNWSIKSLNLHLGKTWKFGLPPPQIKKSKFWILDFFHFLWHFLIRRLPLVFGSWTMKLKMSENAFFLQEPIFGSLFEYLRIEFYKLFCEFFCSPCKYPAKVTSKYHRAGVFGNNRYFAKLNFNFNYNFNLSWD